MHDASSDTDYHGGCEIMGQSLVPMTYLDSIKEFMLQKYGRNWIIWPELSSEPEILAREFFFKIQVVIEVGKKYLLSIYSDEGLSRKGLNRINRKSKCYFFLDQIELDQNYVMEIVWFGFEPNGLNFFQFFIY